MNTEVNPDNKNPHLSCCDADIDDCDWYDFFQTKSEECSTETPLECLDNQIDFNEMNSDGCGKQS
jgi:hypothetical protein